MKKFEVIARPWSMDAKPVAVELDYGEARRRARELGKAPDGAPYEVRERLEASSTAVGSAEVFSFRFAGGGWADFTVNEATGEFHIHSDWGDYCSSWPSAAARGRRSLKEFIATTSDTYIADKLAGAKGRGFENRFDGAATRALFKNRILEAKEGGELGEEDAENLRDEVDDIESDFDDDANLFAMSIAPGLAEFLGEWHQQLIFKDSPAYLFLRDSLMPFFRRHLRSVIAVAEATE